MEVKEVAGLLGYSREKVLTIIRTGLELPKSKVKVKLAAMKRGSTYDVSEAKLNVFISRFEKEEPGRHPPVAVRRDLLVEARHKCAVCRERAPLQFHHMVEWGPPSHHDTAQMLAVCGTDHDLCTKGDIDYESQVKYKGKLLADGREPPANNKKLEQRQFRKARDASDKRIKKMWNDAKGNRTKPPRRNKRDLK